jgi:hypothetical protein
MARILYLHGLRSRPGGVKPTLLAAAGHEVINPHLPDDDFEESLRRARAALDAGRPEVVVGSSRGGAVALNLDTGDRPVVLIAPAWRRWGTAATARPRTTILHSPADAVIPFADSAALVAASGLPPAALVAVGDGHDMVDPAAVAALHEAIRRAPGAG